MTSTDAVLHPSAAGDGREPAGCGGRSLDRSDPAARAWTARAVQRIEADAQRSADTHLLRFPLPEAVGVELYLKDESTHITGSLKHRLARSLFLYALCNGWLTEGTTVIEASSGSTAVSEAYFARLIGLPFVAVMPAWTSPQKIALIQAQGGRCHLVDDAAAIYDESRRLAAECGGHYMDQFTHAERATDWRGNNNIAESIFAQMELERHPVPEWIVIAAGTGGTSATIGRYVRYRGFPTRLCVPDPENSAFFPAWRAAEPSVRGGGSKIEGIGRPRVEPSFVGQVIDRMIRIPDASSVAAMRAVEAVLGKRVGPSTGTNLWAAFTLAAEMSAQGTEGSIVALLCDAGERYGRTYYDDDWVAQQGWDLAPATAIVDEFLTTGRWRG
ncbi:PLP-dependent cysteine synthase family protein [Nakamurella aerolata]|uniref:L-cysteine desulfhydrase Cds1 n=1 Tax=Nakamurella aerolata TaxID=1656892 RepID=A0A849A399_9ACTN|nr:PLP-dependent cysteine synthase family protein [Nakamurella aerolata]NNG35035.1 PLP-dependent cysteine synthase family protein [Nakamurella aerolata]